MAHGKVFHNLDVEYVKDLSQSAVLDRGTANEPFSEDLSLRVLVCLRHSAK